MNYSTRDFLAGTRAIDAIGHALHMNNPEDWQAARAEIAKMPPRMAEALLVVVIAGQPNQSLSAKVPAHVQSTASNLIWNSKR